MALCREVKKYVTGALTGDGGDEFFGGYQRYEWFQKALKAQRLPATFRRLAGKALPLLDRRRIVEALEERLRPRRATGNVDIHRNNAVTASRDRIGIVIVTAAIGA